jgi:hypothetical protein
MRFAILVTSLLGLAAATGCASQATHVAAPDSSDPSWTPPGEATLTVRASEPASAGLDAKAFAAPQPNRCEIKARQIHAANY